jgi:hypothetical protein
MGWRWPSPITWVGSNFPIDPASATASLGEMETPKPETLMWAEFIWRIIREAPEAALTYIALYLAWKELQAKRRRKGVKHVLELHDTVTATDSVHPAILKLGPAIGKATTHLELSVGDMAIINGMAYEDPAFPQF